MWHSILPRIKECIQRNSIIFSEMGLSVNVFEMDNYIQFLYQFQTRATISFTTHIEAAWLEERTDMVDVILNEVLRNLEFILENGLLFHKDLHGIYDQR